MTTEFLLSIPARVNVGIMLFVAAFTCYTLRVNMSINILGMTQPNPMSNRNESTKFDVPDYGPRYDWSADQQSLLLGAYFWGYILTQIPGGILSDWLGGRVIIGLALGLSGIATAFIPFSAKIFSFGAVFVMRFLIGFFCGFIFPAIQNLIAKWVPKNEKGKFMCSITGGSLGTVVTWPVCGYLMQKWGWVYAFYVPAVTTILITIIWFSMVYNTPAEHPRISLQEQEYIEKSLGDTVSKRQQRMFPPITCLLKSLPFWSLLFLHYGSLWAFYFLITGAPKYMNEVLKFDLANAGIFSSIPYFVRFIASFIFGAIGDAITKTGAFKTTTIRKFFCIFSHVIPGLLLYSLGYAGNNAYVCVGLISIALGFNGASTITNLQNPQDLAPNYVAFIFSVINVAGTTSGFFAPIVVAYFTRDRNTTAEWNIIFLISSVLYILPAIFFMIFGSGTVQDWNDDSYKLKEESKRKTRQSDESKF